MIVLDAGHGWEHPGCCNKGVNEQIYSWVLANQVYEAMGGTACSSLRLTRRSPFASPTLYDRSSMSNSMDTDLFVSIHLNASTSPKAYGTEVYYCKGSRKGPELATVMAERILEESGGDRVRTRPASFHVLRKTKAWALLIECCYTTSERDVKQLHTQEFGRGMVMGITRGIGECMKVLGKVPRIKT